MTLLWVGTDSKTPQGGVCVLNGTIMHNYRANSYKYITSVVLVSNSDSVAYYGKCNI